MAEKLRPPPSKRIDAGAIPVAETLEATEQSGDGSTVKSTRRASAASQTGQACRRPFEADRSRACGMGSMPSRLRQFFRRVKPPRAAAGWKPARTSRSVGQDHCPPPSFSRRVNPPRRGRCFESSRIGSNRLGCKSSALRHWPVAQKQSARPISEGRRSVTVQANQFRRVNPARSGAAVLTRAAISDR